MELPKGIDGVRNFGKEFREFIMKTNMFALALGVVIGGAVGKVVDAVVADLLMPVISAVDTSGDWRGWVVPGPVKLKFGHLLGVTLDFAIIALVVFVVMKAFLKSAPPPPSKVCPACKESINPEATRCKFCTTEQPKA